MEFSQEMLPKLAGKITGWLKDGDVVALSGPLASGKTTLVKAIVSELGYEKRVSSPTFVLERRYRISWGKVKEIIHLDFYRLSAEEINSFDWQEHVGQPGTITFVEWPEVIATHLPKNVKTIKLTIIDDHTRRLTFSKNFGD